MVDYKRLIISIATGAVLGVACIIGVGGRVEGGYAGNVGYLIGIWAMRVVLGIIIGLAAGIILIKGEGWEKWVNAGVRGTLFGLIVSAAVLLMDQYVGYTTFVAGIAYGTIIDLVATFFTREKKEKVEKEEKD
ncbi:MAG: hypothetical protein GOP50_09575 [Candidatus Heimdallarchaeota archaeon]|nr:hypothetical protein [Candidatus Heimdallarchaeota archaeon]